MYAYSDLISVMASNKKSSAAVKEAVITTAQALGFTIKKEQLDVVTNFVMEKDVFAVLPTGYGKSLCYECLPGVFNQLHFDNSSHCSIIVVLSPLIAIMKDQVSILSYQNSYNTNDFNFVYCR